MSKLTRRIELTFKANLNNGRHGWLRLTPAYAATLVEQLLRKVPADCRVLDPFAGTGTTGLVCAEQGFACDMVEINPFLAWLAQAKIRRYAPACVERVSELAHEAASRSERNLSHPPEWIPPMHRIERWWLPQRLHVLAHLYAAIRRLCEPEPEQVAHLLLIAFCQTLMRWSNAGYHHPSVTFKTTSPSLFTQDEASLILQDFVDIAHQVACSAQENLRGEVEVFLGDARKLECLQGRLYDAVITSPPYPNRISYVREVRPFLYWLGFLKEPREAGELDWQAIGGTWGVATSRLNSIELETPSLYAILGELRAIVRAIDEKNPLLSRYVLRYFQDMQTHFMSLSPLLRTGAQVYYVVGNAKFYEVVVPAEQLLARLMEASGIIPIQVEPLRKRNSKKELVEFLISAEKR